MPTLGDLGSGRLNSFQGPGGAAPAIGGMTNASLMTLQGMKPPDDFSGPQWSQNGVTWNRNQQTGVWENPSSDDPVLSKLIGAGGLTLGDNGINVDASKLPSTAYGQFGQFRSPDVNIGPDGQPTVEAGKMAVGNPGAVQWDPNYGWITPSSNMQNKDDWYDKFSGTILPSLIASGLTAGGLGAIGAVGGAGAGLGNAMPAFQSAGSALTGGKFNPMSLLSIAGGGNPELANLLSILSKGYQGVQAAQNLKTNPVGSGITLAKLAGGAING